MSDTMAIPVADPNAEINHDLEIWLGTLEPSRMYLGFDIARKWKSYQKLRQDGHKLIAQIKEMSEQFNQADEKHTSSMSFGHSPDGPVLYADPGPGKIPFKV